MDGGEWGIPGIAAGGLWCVTAGVDAGVQGVMGGQGGLVLVRGQGGLVLLLINLKQGGLVLVRGQGGLVLVVGQGGLVLVVGQGGLVLLLANLKSSVEWTERCVLKGLKANRNIRTANVLCISSTFQVNYFPWIFKFIDSSSNIHLNTANLKVNFHIYSSTSTGYTPSL